MTCGLHLLFLYLIEKHKWRSVFPWLRFVDQTLFTHSILFRIICTLPQEVLWWTGGSCSGEISLPGTGLRRNAKCASTRKYFRGLGDLRLSAAYINFLTPFRAAYNRVNTVWQPYSQAY